MRIALLPSIAVTVLLLSGNAISVSAQEGSKDNATEVRVVEPPQGYGWSFYAWITGGLVTAGLAVKRFLKKNVDMKDPRVVATVRVASQVALIGLAILVLNLAKKLRKKEQDNSQNAKFINSVLSELIKLAKWMSAAVISEKVAPKMDPKALAKSLGAQPETIQMLVDTTSQPTRRRQVPAQQHQAPVPVSYTHLTLPTICSV